jgi:hypothetical protein
MALGVSQSLEKCQTGIGERKTELPIHPPMGGGWGKPCWTSTRQAHYTYMAGWYIFTPVNTLCCKPHKMIGLSIFHGMMIIMLD